jgi:phosphatidylinositol alpha-1,6-mannosyltransferase
VFPPIVGGSGRWMWELYRRLPRDNFVMAVGDHPEAAEFDATHDFDVHRLPIAFSNYGTLSPAGFNRYRRIALCILRLAREREVAAIHCGALFPDGWIGRLVSKKLRLPLLVYLHGEEVGFTNSSRQLHWMAQRILRDADRVIVNSNNTRRIAVDHWRVADAKIHLVYPGVDTERFVPAERSLQVRTRLGWGDRPVVLTVGRLEKRKGHDILLQALPAIRRQFPEVLYAVVGDGDERNRLEQLTVDLGLRDHVSFHGELSEEHLVECYQQCDLFVLPNRGISGNIEGFGIVLLEAQSTGKPVIAGESGGTREAMQVSQTGLIVDCSGPSMIAAEINKLLSNPQRRCAMGKAGRAWVCNRFNWRICSEQAQQIFNTLSQHSVFAAAGGR